jgi:hypothetical protein
MFPKALNYFMQIDDVILVHTEISKLRSYTANVFNIIPRLAFEPQGSPFQISTNN